MKQWGAAALQHHSPIKEPRNLGCPPYTLSSPSAIPLEVPSFGILTAWMHPCACVRLRYPSASKLMVVNTVSAWGMGAKSGSVYSNAASPHLRSQFGLLRKASPFERVAGPNTSQPTCLLSLRTAGDLISLWLSGSHQVRPPLTCMWHPNSSKVRSESVD